MNIKIENNKIYSPIRDKWLVLTPEEQVRQNYICRLVNVYGYDIVQSVLFFYLIQKSKAITN